MEQQNDAPQSGFDGLGISPNLKKAVDKLGFSEPTPIQKKSIPVALAGDDVIGIAQTGTGKTFAFGIPMIQRVGSVGGKGLVVLPTRELALQVDEELKKLAGHLGLRTAIVIGGAAMGRQVDQIRKRPHVVIGTPGRIIDHLDQGTLKLDDVTALVLDEADRMLDMGFAPQIKRILAKVPKERQTMLFSATMPEDIATIARTHMKTPVRVEVARPGTTSETVEQELFVVEKGKKLQLLEKLLNENTGSVLVFSRTKHGAKRITAIVQHMGFKAAEIHSNRTLNQRREALDGFKKGKYRVLIATDIAARGIDVTGIGLVINFDVPDQADDYVHRIGRTGRAGHKGKAITFATPDQGKEIRQIERLARVMLPISKLPHDLPPPRVQPRVEGRDEGRRGGYGGRKGGFDSRHGGFGGGGRGHRESRPNEYGRREGNKTGNREGRPGHSQRRGPKAPPKWRDMRDK